MCKSSLVQAWEQYSAGACTKAVVEVLSMLNERSQLRPTRHFIKATRDETFVFNFRMRFLKVRLRSSRVMPKYVKLFWNGRSFLRGILL